MILEIFGTTRVEKTFFGPYRPLTPSHKHHVGCLRRHPNLSLSSRDQDVKAGVIIALPKTHETLPDELKLLRAGLSLQRPF